MSRKIGEEFFRAIAKHHAWYWHKYGDVRYCMNCHQPLPKSENAPDFAVGFLHTWVEAKNSDASDTWRWTEIAEDGARANQRKWLLENKGWLFIVLGPGPAPGKRSGYLIPFHTWVEEIEPILIDQRLMSIRRDAYGKRPGADQYLARWRLDWEKGGFVIPPLHEWWRVLKGQLLSQLLEVEKYAPTF